MHNIRTIYSKEVAGYFKSPMAYIFLVSFVLLNGYFFSNTFFLINQSDMRALFNIVPLVYLFFCPVVTLGMSPGSSSQSGIPSATPPNLRSGIHQKPPQEMVLLVCPVPLVSWPCHSSNPLRLELATYAIAHHLFLQ